MCPPLQRAALATSFGAMGRRRARDVYCARHPARPQSSRDRHLLRRPRHLPTSRRALPLCARHAQLWDAALLRSITVPSRGAVTRLECSPWPCMCKSCAWLPHFAGGSGSGMEKRGAGCTPPVELRGREQGGVTTSIRQSIGAPPQRGGLGRLPSVSGGVLFVAHALCMGSSAARWPAPAGVRGVGA